MNACIGEGPPLQISSGHVDGWSYVLISMEGVVGGRRNDTTRFGAGLTTRRYGIYPVNMVSNNDGGNNQGGCIEGYDAERSQAVLLQNKGLSPPSCLFLPRL